MKETLEMLLFHYRPFLVVRFAKSAQKLNIEMSLEMQRCNEIEKWNVLD